MPTWKKCDALSSRNTMKSTKPACSLSWLAADRVWVGKISGSLTNRRSKWLPPYRLLGNVPSGKLCSSKHIRLASNERSMQLGGNRQPWTVCVTESAVSTATVRPDGKSNRNSCRSSQFACSSLAPPGTVERVAEICQNTFAAHLPPAVISKQST